MVEHVVALLGDKSNKTELKHIKSFDFDPEEVTYSTGWVIMSSASDGEQRGNATLAINKNSNGYELTLSGSFINKRKFDGDHFVAIAGLLDASGQVIERMQVRRGLDGMWKNLRFKTRRGGATTRKEVASLSDANVILLSLGYHDAISDKAFWDKAAEIAAEIAKALLADKKKEDDTLN